MPRDAPHSPSPTNQPQTGGFPEAEISRSGVDVAWQAWAARVGEDCRRQPEQYLDETIVPFGGE